MTTLKVKAIKHLNVYEKEQFYLQFDTLDGDKRYTINVGQKTYEAIKDMEKPEVENVEDKPKPQGRTGK